MGISSRVFGSDIDPKIKEKLKKRQAVAETPDPNTSVVEYQSSFNTLADLSSRTPFARMWTAVQIQTLGEKKISEHYGGSNSKKWPSQKERKADWENHKVIYLRDGREVKFRKVTAKGSKIISIGNHILNTLPNPNASIDDSDGIFLSSQQANKNEFMMPPEGITSVTSGTEGMLGAIKKTTVNFIVNNFHDYEQIYSRYFLKPGARLFVDFGWDTANLYDPKELLKGDQSLEKIEKTLYDETKGYVTKSAGDLDTIIGVVTSFDSKIRENGSIECSVELVSNNAALFSRDIDNRLKKLIYHSLDIEILRYAAMGYIGTGEDTNHNIIERSKKWSLSAESKADWEKIFFDFASEKLSSDDNFPDKDSTVLGVFFKKTNNAKSLYVSWGFFEDKILNRHLGFGETGKNTSEPSMKSDPIFDSSDSFIRYNGNLMKSQMYKKTLGAVQPWLYPKEWNETYNTHRKKIPGDTEYPENIKKISISRKKRSSSNISSREFQGPEDRAKDYTKHDKGLHRIPLRELFISVELIKEKLNNSSNITEFIKAILGTINTSTNNTFDLQAMSSDKSNSSIRFIDRNFVKLDNSGEENWFDNLFMFKPGSPNSIVKTYDISFSTPKGGLQNLMAIQSMGSSGTYFPISDVLDKALATELLNRLETKEENIQIVYLPEFGRYRGEQLEEEQSISTGMALNFYESDSIFTGKYSGISSGAEIATEENIRKAETEGKRVKKEKTTKGEDAKVEAEMEQAEGMKVASTISEYYLFKAQADIFIEQLSTIMPATLSLGIYGISSLLPGDLIRVDYLPKKYRDNVFFQITKVNHNISTSTWTTDLETVIRPQAKLKKDSDISPYFKPTEVVLNKEVLKTLPGHEGSRDAKFIIPFIRKLKLLDEDHGSGVDYTFSFIAKRTWSEDDEGDLHGLKKLTAGDKFRLILYKHQPNKWLVQPYDADVNRNFGKGTSIREGYANIPVS